MPRGWTVLPTRAHAEAVVRRGLAGGRGAVLLPPVITLRELEESAVLSAMPSSPRLDDLALRAILFSTARRIPASAPHGSAAGTAGFVTALDATRRALRRGGVHAEDLRAALRAMPESSRRRRLEGLARILAEIDLRVSATSAMDEADQPWALARALEAGGRVNPRFAGTRVEVREIHDYYPARLAWLDALDARLRDAGGGVTLVVPHREGSRWFEHTRRLLWWLERRGDRGAEVRPEDPFEDAEAAGRIGTRVLRAMESPRGAEDVGGIADSVTLGVLPDRAAEAGAIARFVFDAVEGGTAPEAIVVASPLIEVHGPLLLGALEDLGIPAHDRRGAPVVVAPPVRWVLDALAAVERGLPAETVATLLASCYVQAPDDATSIRRLLKEAGAVADYPDPTSPRSGALADALRRNARYLGRGGLGAARVASLAASLDAWLQPLRALRDPGTVSDHVARLRRLLAHVDLTAHASRGAARLLLGDPRDPLIRAEGRALARDRAASRALEVAIDRMPSAVKQAGLAAEMLPLFAFRWFLSDALAAEQTTPAGASGNAVRVLPLSEAAGLGADVVIVAALEDGAFPQARPDDPLLPRTDRRALADHADRVHARALDVDLGAGLDRDAARHEQALLFARIVSSARSRLFLTRAATDDRGRPIGESRYLVSLRESMDRAGVALRVERRPPEPVLPLALARGPREVRRALAKAPHLLDRVTTLDRDAGAGLASVLERARIEAVRLESQRKRVALDGYSGLLAGLIDLSTLHGGLAAADPNVPLSTTALGRAARCAFQDFGVRVLGLHSPSDPASDLAPREWGQLAHACLEEVFRRLAPGGATMRLPTDPKRVEKIARRVASEIVRAWPESHPVADPVLFEARAEEVIARVVAAAEVIAREAARPGEWRIEQAFGAKDDPASWPALVVPVEGGDAAHLRGRIDFVEIGTEQAVVTDFKRGKLETVRRPLGPDQLLTTGLQLPIYAAATRMAHPDQTVDARYFALGSERSTDGLRRLLAGEGATGAAKGWRERAPDPHQILTVEGPTELARAVGALVLAMRSGHHPVAPRGDACRHCELSAVCRVRLTEIEGDGDSEVDA